MKNEAIRMLTVALISAGTPWVVVPFLILTIMQGDKKEYIAAFMTFLISNIILQHSLPGSFLLLFLLAAFHKRIGLYTGGLGFIAAATLTYSEGISIMPGVWQWYALVGGIGGFLFLLGRNAEYKQKPREPAPSRAEIIRQRIAYWTK